MQETLLKNGRQYRSHPVGVAGVTFRVQYSALMNGKFLFRASSCTGTAHVTLRVEYNALMKDSFFLFTVKLPCIWRYRRRPYNFTRTNNALMEGRL